MHSAEVIFPAAERAEASERRESLEGERSFFEIEAGTVRTSVTVCIFVYLIIREGVQIEGKQKTGNVKISSREYAQN
jgi:hypothetical protein